jgi:hypothetical protein
MDEMLGHRPASRPPVLFDTSAPLDLSEERKRDMMMRAVTMKMVYEANITWRLAH